MTRTVRTTAALAAATLATAVTALVAAPAHAQGRHTASEPVCVGTSPDSSGDNWDVYCVWLPIH